MSKTVAVLISGAEQGKNLVEVTIERGTRVADILRKLNLDGFILSREGSGQYWANEETIYDAITDGDKLRATPVAVLGTILAAPSERYWERFTRKLESRFQTAVLQTATPNLLPPRSRVRVLPSHEPYWRFRGWRREGSHFVGAYRTQRGSYFGRIDVSTCPPRHYIKNPPSAVLEGSHGACFRARSGGWYWIHFNQPQQDPDAGILETEHYLTQSLTPA